MSDNPLGDAGLTSLVHGLEAMPAMERVGCADTGASPEGARLVLAALAERMAPGRGGPQCVQLGRAVGGGGTEAADVVLV